LERRRGPQRPPCPGHTAQPTYEAHSGGSIALAPSYTTAPGIPRADAVHAPALVPIRVGVRGHVWEGGLLTAALSMNPKVVPDGLHACTQHQHSRCAQASEARALRASAMWPARTRGSVCLACAALAPLTWKVLQAGHRIRRLFAWTHGGCRYGAAGCQLHHIACARCRCQCGRACGGTALSPLHKHRVLHYGVEQPGVSRVGGHNPDLQPGSREGR
jgi:hypothetical protein